MRRFLSLFTVLMLSGVLAFAQSRVVTGKVIDNTGKPVSFASVSIKGARTGVTTDVNGEYRIKVNNGDVLLVSQLNYNPIEVTVGSSSSTLTTSLELKSNTIKEVIVTSAFGTKRAARSTSSNVQNVNADALNTARQTDVNNALAGKVAGIQVRSQSGGKLGEASAIRLRGENGFGAGAGPIYVIDGTIIPNSNDINPDDIEDITVLQGPAAAGLFGPDGVNGAIVINTKKARKGAGMGIELNLGVSFDKVGTLPSYQNAYSGGDGGSPDLYRYNYKAGDPEGWKALDGKYYHDYKNDASWGPKMVGQEYIPWYAWYPGSEYSFKTAKLTPQPNNIKDFYNTGITKTNNVNFTKSGDGYSVRVSYTNLDIKGIIPTQFLKRNTLNTNFSIDLTNRLTVGANINYIAQNDNVENNDTYGNQSSGSFGSWFHRDLEIDKLRELQYLTTPTGVLASWNHANPSAFNASKPDGFYKANYWFNHYSYFDNIKNVGRRDRIFGDVSLQYKINNDLKIKATYRKQQLTTVGTDTYYQILQESIAQGQWNPYEANSNAAYAVSNSYSDRQNYELLLSYSKKIRDFAINANAGLDILKTRSRTYAANTFGGLNVPGLYSLANSKDPVENSTRTDKSQETVDQSRRRSLFVRADVGYKNFLFVEGTFRRDYISTQPSSDPYIDTKSIGGSFVFSDLIKSAIPFLSYGKLRASYGQILAQLAIYQLNSTYAVNPNQWDGNFLMSEPNTLVSPTLTGAVNTEKEYGIDLRFVKNRIGLSATYYDRTNKKFPANVSVAYATGYTAISTNVGEVAKTGVELQLFLQPIKMKNFEWEINGTWARDIKNEVVSISPGIDRLVSASGNYGGTYAPQAVSAVGQRWGQLFGTGYKRDANGVPILKDGLFIPQTQLNFGSVLPDYTGGVQTKFTILKNFTINVNIDYSYGGKYFSLSDFWGTTSGLTARTAAINDKGNSVRDLVQDGGGVHVVGVDEAGKTVDTYVDAYAYFHQFQNNQINEGSIYDLSFVKMREVSLGYRIPLERLKINKYITSATFSVLLKNPWLIYTKSKQFDPSEISGVQGENGQIPGTKSVGVNLRIGF